MRFIKDMEDGGGWMEDIHTSARVAVRVHTSSTSVRSRSFIAQKASYRSKNDSKIQDVFAKNIFPAGE